MYIKVRKDVYEFGYGNGYKYTCYAESIFKAKEMFLLYIGNLVDVEINYMLEESQRS